MKAAGINLNYVSHQSLKICAEGRGGEPPTQTFFGLVTQSSLPMNVCRSQGNIPYPMFARDPIKTADLAPNFLTSKWVLENSPKKVRALIG